MNGAQTHPLSFRDRSTNHAGFSGSAHVNRFYVPFFLLPSSSFLLLFRVRRVRCCSVALSDDEALLATGCSDGSLTIFDVGAGGGGGGAVRHLLRHPDTVISLRWISRALNHYHSPPASSSSSPSDGTAQNLSADTVSMLKRQWAGKLAASCADGAVYLWDARDGKLVQRLTGHCGMIIDVQVAFTAAAAPFNAASSASNPLRPIVVTAGDDGVSRVFEIG